MRLEKFKEKDNKRIGIVVFTIVCILLVSGVILYRTFAIFEVNNNFNVINGEVEDPGDIYFAFYKDEQIQKDMPQKEEGYVLDESKSYCGVTGGNDSNIKVFVTEDGLYEVKHDDVTEINEGFKTTEYRYAGKDPNNYIKFNDEEWRIIGLVNVMTDEKTVEQRVKIIRKDSIGSYSWNSTATNDWTSSALMKMLNEIYYASAKGDCYIKEDNVAKQKTCDFTEKTTNVKGINKISRLMIDEDIIWNIGGVDINNNDDYYAQERKLNQTEWKKENSKDVEFHSIGLMYPSDYAYSLNAGNDSWVSVSSYYWTIVPNVYNDNSVVSIQNDGQIVTLWVIHSTGTLPTLYLKTNVKILNDDTDGSITNSYKLAQLLKYK